MRRMRNLFLLFFLLFWTTPVALLAADNVPQSSTVDGQTSQQTVPDLSTKIDFTQINAFLEKLDADVQSSMPGFSLTKTFEDLKGGKISLQPEQLGRTFLIFLGREMIKSAPLIGKLLILAVLCAILQQLQNAFSGSVAKISELMAYLVLLGIALASFQTAIDVAKGAIDSMVGLMQSFFPVMFTLLLAMGSLTTAALFKPVVIGSLTFLATLLKTIVLPLFFLGTVLRLFNQVSSNFKLSRLAGLFEFSAKVSLGLVLTLFLGVMAIQGVTGGVTDGVILRTAKYSADLIPVVGKAFKDAVELVMGSGLIIKNAVGIVAILALVVICLDPILKIVAMIFVFRISAALVEPLGEQNLADSLQAMAKSLIYVFSTVASVAIMFFITIAIVVGSGNLTVMLR